jgi:hypothetical protein
MITLDVANGKPWFSQRNNQLFYWDACNVTSMVAALTYSGIKLPSDPKYDQPEDSLLSFLRSDSRVDLEYQKLFPDMYNIYIANNRDPHKCTPPNELHPLLSYGTNLWLGGDREQYTKFRWDLTQQEVIYEIVKGHAVVQSGLWANLNHITCMTGLDTNQDDIINITDINQIDLSKITNMIMEDPWGDYHDNYKTQRGRDIVVSQSDYLSLVKPFNSNTKWGHLIIVK